MYKKPTICTLFSIIIACLSVSVHAQSATMPPNTTVVSPNDYNNLSIEQYLNLSSPEFQKFLNANHIIKLMRFYGSPLTANSSGEPMLMVNGQYLPSSDVLKTVPTDRDGVMQGFVYTLKGIEPGTPDSDIRLFGTYSLYAPQDRIEIRSRSEKGWFSDSDEFWIYLWFYDGPNWQSYGSKVLGERIYRGRLDTPGRAYSIGWEKDASDDQGKVVSPAGEDIFGPEPTRSIVISATREQMTQAMEALRQYQQLPKESRLKGKWQLVHMMLLQAGIQPSLINADIATPKDLNRALSQMVQRGAYFGQLPNGDWSHY